MATLTSSGQNKLPQHWDLIVNFFRASLLPVTAWTMNFCFKQSGIHVFTISVGTAAGKGRLQVWVVEAGGQGTGRQFSLVLKRCGPNCLSSRSKSAWEFLHFLEVLRIVCHSWAGGVAQWWSTHLHSCLAFMKFWFDPQHPLLQNKKKVIPRFYGLLTFCVEILQ